MLLSNVIVNISEISNFDTRYGNIMSQKTKKVDSETLYKRCNIDLGKSKKNVIQPTQLGVQRCLHSTQGRQYLTNDQMIRYKHMPDPVYSDTIKSGIVSKWGKKY